MLVNLNQLKDEAKEYIKSKEKQDYFDSYRIFRNYIKELEFNSEDEYIKATSLVYSWMPTVLRIHDEENDIDRFHEILKKVKTEKWEDESLSRDDFELVKSVINNSIIGGSKLLHFINPEKYPIWDKWVSLYLFGTNRGNSIPSYIKYRNWILKIVNEDKKDKVYDLILNQMEIGKHHDYPMTKVRAFEQVCFCAGKEKYT